MVRRMGLSFIKLDGLTRYVSYINPSTLATGYSSNYTMTEAEIRLAIS
jgi:hypothetical protein